MFTLIYDKRVEAFLKKASERDQAKAYKYVFLFQQYGFSLNQIYLKKVNQDVWELRPGKIRLFFIKISNKHVIIHAMYKKSQQITKATLALLNHRIKDYYG